MRKSYHCLKNVGRATARIGTNCHKSGASRSVYADTDISPLVSYMFLLLPLQVLNIRFNKDTGGETIEIT